MKLKFKFKTLKLFIRLLVSIFLFRISFKSLDQFPTTVSMVKPSQQRTVGPNQSLVWLVAKYEDQVILDKFQPLFEQLIMLKQNLQNLEHKVKLCQRDLKFLKQRNNIDRNSDLSEFQNSILTAYETRLSQNLDALENCRKNYRSQQKLLNTLITELPLEKKESVKDFLNRLNDTADTQYPSEVSSLLKSEIEQVKIKFFDDSI